MEKDFEYLGFRPHMGSGIDFSVSYQRNVYFSTRPDSKIAICGDEYKVLGSFRLYDNLQEIVEKSVHVTMVSSAAEMDGIALVDPRDPDPFLKAALSIVVQRNFAAFIEAEPTRIPSVWMKLALDEAANRFSYYQHSMRELAAAEQGTESFSALRFWADQVENVVHEITSIDERLAGFSHLSAGRYGYVVLLDGQLHDRRKPYDFSGEGWIARHLFAHFQNAHWAAKDLGKDAVIKAVTISRGRVMERTQKGDVPFQHEPDPASSPVPA